MNHWTCQFSLGVECANPKSSSFVNSQSKTSSVSPTTLFSSRGSVSARSSAHQNPWFDVPGTAAVAGKFPFENRILVQWSEAGMAMPSR